MTDRESFPTAGGNDPTVAPVIVQPLGVDRALVLGSPNLVERFGLREQRIPPGALQVIRDIALAAPSLQGLAGDLGGGVVRLTPQARTLLAEHGPMLADNGALMGVVRGADGRFKGLLTLQEVSTLGSVAANLPAVVGAVALQAQLSVIERKLDQIQADVTEIIRDGQIEVLAEAQAMLGILADVHDDVTETGLLTGDDWDRISALELPIKRLHVQTRAQLGEVARTLGEPGIGLGRRVLAVAGAVRNDRVRFWFEAHVIAEVALTRWDLLRLQRLLRADDPRLERETEETREALGARRTFTEEFASELAAYLGRAGRVEGWLDHG